MLTFLPLKSSEKEVFSLQIQMYLIRGFLLTKWGLFVYDCRYINRIGARR